MRHTLETFERHQAQLVFSIATPTRLARVPARIICQASSSSTTSRGSLSRDPPFKYSPLRSSIHLIRDPFFTQSSSILLLHPPRVSYQLERQTYLHIVIPFPARFPLISQSIVLIHLVLAPTHRRRPIPAFKMDTRIASQYPDPSRRTLPALPSHHRHSPYDQHSQQQASRTWYPPPPPPPPAGPDAHFAYPDHSPNATSPADAASPTSSSQQDTSQRAESPCSEGASSQKRKSSKQRKGEPTSSSTCFHLPHVSFSEGGAPTGERNGMGTHRARV